MGAVLIATIFLQLLSPLLLRHVIDSAVSGVSLGILLATTVAFLSITLIEQTSRVFASHLGTKVSWAATNSLRMDLATHSLRLDMSYHNNHTPGEMVELIDGDSSTLGGFFSIFAAEILGSMVLLFGILLILFLEDWRIGTVLALFCVLALAFILSMRSISVPHWHAASRARAESFGYLEID